MYKDEETNASLFLLRLDVNMQNATENVFLLDML
jgi:hypothetical protein